MDHAKVAAAPAMTGYRNRGAYRYDRTPATHAHSVTGRSSAQCRDHRAQQRQLRLSFDINARAIRQSNLNGAGIGFINRCPTGSAGFSAEEPIRRTGTKLGSLSGPSRPSRTWRRQLNSRLG
jgi:hypothetical protein